MARRVSRSFVRLLVPTALTHACSIRRSASRHPVTDVRGLGRNSRGQSVLVFRLVAELCAEGDHRDSDAAEQRLQEAAQTDDRNLRGHPSCEDPARRERRESSVFVSAPRGRRGHGAAATDSDPEEQAWNPVVVERRSLEPPAGDRWRAPQAVERTADRVDGGQRSDRGDRSLSPATGQSWLRRIGIAQASRRPYRSRTLAGESGRGVPLRQARDQSGRSAKIGT